MSIYVTNDLHGNKTITSKVANSIKSMVTGDVLILNGDGAGARGPIMNKLVKIFYEVRRGETDYKVLISALSEIIGQEPDIPTSWVYDSVHAGIFRAVMAKYFKPFNQCVESEILQALEETMYPLAQVAKENGVKIIYSPGNGEIVPSDFSVDNIAIEEALPPEERFYQKLHKQGYFEDLGIQYVPYVLNLSGKIAVIGTNLLDLDTSQAREQLNIQGLLGDTGGLKAIIAHYPPGISPLGKIFSFWSPNKVDRERSEALEKIIQRLQPNDIPIYFGHIHLGPDDPGMTAYPSILGFQFASRYGF